MPNSQTCYRILCHGGSPYFQADHWSETRSFVKGDTAVTLTGHGHEHTVQHTDSSSRRNSFLMSSHSNGSCCRLLPASFWLVALPIPSFNSSIDCPAKSSGRFGPPGLFSSTCALMLLLLFAVLISTALCRMFGYGQHTTLQLNSNDIVCSPLCRRTDPR